MYHYDPRWKLADSAGVGAAIRLARRARGLQQDDLAKRLDVSRMTVSRMERGGAVSVDTALRALTVCGVDLIGFSRSEHVTANDKCKGNPSDPCTSERLYPAIYREVVFPLLDGVGDPFFDPTRVVTTPEDKKVFDQLFRSGAVIRAGTRWAIGQPHKALLIFAAGELVDTSRLWWSDPETCAPLIESESLIPGSSEAVLAHYGLEFNPIGTPPITIWHGRGPSAATTIERDGWLPWVPDGLSGKVPLTVAYADLFCTPGWEAQEFADYVLRRTIPTED